MTAEVHGGIDHLVKKPDPQESLAMLADDINECHHRVDEHSRHALKYAIQAGDFLLEAKGQVPYGSWEKWLGQNCKFQITLARIYMRLSLYQALITHSGVDSIRKAMDVCAGLPNQTTSEPLRAEALARKRDNPAMSVRAIADEMDVPYSTIQLWLNPSDQRRRPREGETSYTRPRSRQIVACPHCGGKLYKDGTAVVIEPPSDERNAE